MRISLILLVLCLVFSVFLRSQPLDELLILDLLPVVLLGFSAGLVYLKQKVQSVGGADFVVLAAMGIQSGVVVTLLIIIVAGMIGILVHVLKSRGLAAKSKQINRQTEDSFAALGMTEEEMKNSAPKYPFAAYLCILWFVFLVVTRFVPELSQSLKFDLYDFTGNTGAL